MKNFWIYWGDNNISCFWLKSKAQAESIAKQYKNVIKIEEKVLNKSNNLCYNAIVLRENRKG